MDGVSDRPWSGVSRSSYPTAVAYCAACVIDENPAGAPKIKERCKLPVFEPPALGGQLNRRAVRAAALRLLRNRGGVQAPEPVKIAAARRLCDLYARIEERPPASLVDLAGGHAPEMQLAE